MNSLRATGATSTCLIVDFIDIKLVIAMHDRYSLGCWGTDAYVKKYNLPVTGCTNGVPDSSTFYTNSNAIADVRELKFFVLLSIALS